ncbi:M24 family metallopeptidase [Cryptosporangium aurantiacum]|uniref:Xaa-Pro aminopeptidase n=1 Tax=Cryptosporangium aurantiacum TaxID=134849 RepID=A0A1M7RFT5_9ACTN|nr:Xaa-Pro peptidase family protein [Cryptosporangium aurantiacum]SHN45100.1 Xaa-Pro aminopeptidase [Cryptosporangium aurantiacum]
MTQAPYRPWPRRSPAVDAEDLRSRLERATGEAARSGFDGILATPGPDLRYLCGYTPASGADRLTVLVLSPGQDPTLVVPRRDERAAAASPAAAALTVVAWDDTDGPYRPLSDLLDPAGVYAVSDSAWARHLLGIERVAPAVVFHPVSEALPMLRALKGEEEVAQLEMAAAAVDFAYADVVQGRFAGRTEQEVTADLARCLYGRGHSRVDAAVATGPSGADPLHTPGHRPIQFGDAVVLRLGGVVDGYRADLVRTVSVGPPSPELHRFHDAVYRAQQAATDAVRPGVPGQDIERAARRVLLDAGHAKAHCAAHGVGLTADEPPWPVEGDVQPLNVGMCFAFEVGVHLTGRFGVRLGDVVTVTRAGRRVLNRAPHELAVVY